MTRKQLIAAMKKEQKILAASRDKLRSLENVICELEDDSVSASEHLEDAIDSLSRTI